MSTPQHGNYFMPGSKSATVFLAFFIAAGALVECNTGELESKKPSTDSMKPKTEHSLTP